MSNNSNAERRRQLDDPHRMSVRYNAGLQVVCSCGVLLSRRDEDRREITLSDLLMLSRGHFSELHGGR